MIEKKFELIGESASNKATEVVVSGRYNPDWLIEKWINSELVHNRDLDAPVAKLALERFHGPHIGHEVLRRLDLGEIDEAESEQSDVSLTEVSETENQDSEVNTEDSEASNS